MNVSTLDPVDVPVITGSYTVTVVGVAVNVTVRGADGAGHVVVSFSDAPTVEKVAAPVTVTPAVVVTLSIVEPEITIVMLRGGAIPASTSAASSMTSDVSVYVPSTIVPPVPTVGAAMETVAVTGVPAFTTVLHTTVASPWWDDPESFVELPLSREDTPLSVFAEPESMEGAPVFVDDPLSSVREPESRVFEDASRVCCVGVLELHPATRIDDSTMDEDFIRPF